jgi:PAS domain S-box-containing protein
MNKIDTKPDQVSSNNETLLAAILNAADYVIITTDTNGIIQRFNKAAESHLGYSADELVEKLTPAVFHDPDEVMQRAKQLSEEGISVEPGFAVFAARSRLLPGGDTNTWTYVRKDGTRFPVSLTVTALRDDSGEIYAFLCTANNLSERRAVRRIKAQYAAIIDSSTDAIMSKDLDGNVMSWNPAAVKMFGYTAHEMIGQPMSLLIPEDRAGEELQILEKIKRGESIEHFETIRKRKNGTIFPISVTISPIKDDAGVVIGASKITRDITERIKMDRMKSEFISTVSHELRTPLTSIRGALALLVGGVAGELSEKVKPLIDIAHKNSERLILLVNDILDMEKIEAGKMEFDMQPFKLMPLLEHALVGNHAYAEQFKVSYELENSLPDVMIKADANRLMQVFANLLSNAAKFSPAGGKVMVSVERIESRIRVSVKDNGSGIPDEFKEQIFKKFAQADSSDTRKKGGTGLGLSITKAMIEQMGGSIGFESEPNVQTTFFFEFPLWHEPVAEVAVAHVTEQKTPAAGQRILICEDDRDVAALLRLMLEQIGLAADIAYDATQAKEMLFHGEYAAMTLDLGLPDQDGISLIRKLRATPKTADIPILVVSGNAAEGRKELNSEVFNVVDWITKPIDQSQLESALKQAMRQASNAHHSDTHPRVLHIEDDEDIAGLVSTIVGEVAQVDNAYTLAEARRMLQSNIYNLAILDITLPDGSGMELLPILNGATPPIPVLIFSANETSKLDARQVSSALVKSRTDNAQLLAKIKQLVGKE